MHDRATGGGLALWPGLLLALYEVHVEIALRLPNRDVEPPTDARRPGLYQLPDNRCAELVPGVMAVGLRAVGFSLPGEGVAPRPASGLHDRLVLSRGRCCCWASELGLQPRARGRPAKGTEIGYLGNGGKFGHIHHGAGTTSGNGGGDAHGPVGCPPTMGMASRRAEPPTAARVTPPPEVAGSWAAVTPNSPRSPRIQRRQGGRRQRVQVR
jgi:hypothetical protein